MVPAVVLVPVFKPGDGLRGIVENLRATGAAVVVVDDGSGPAADAVLAGIEAMDATVLRHPVNRGKGVALRTGFQHVLDTHPDRPVVTADADGQHDLADILRIARHVTATGRLTLGVRTFDGDVPARSRVGNVVTRLLFRAATGRDVRDTQTGLRAYPADQLAELLNVPGDRFDYEMNVLLAAARAGHPVDELPIATRYAPDNPTSHFSALSDSVLVYRPLLRYATLALLGAGGRSG